MDTIPAPGQAAPELPPELEELLPTAVERPEAPAGRLRCLRARLARSNSAIGQGLLALLSRGGLDKQSWEDLDDTLLVSDLGIEAATELVERLRTGVKVEGTTDEATVREWLRRSSWRRSIRLPADPSYLNGWRAIPR